MGSPWPVICIAAFYVYFVRSLGPHFMKNRPAFNVDLILRVYNLLQIFLCIYTLNRVSQMNCGLCLVRTAVRNSSWLPYEQKTGETLMYLESAVIM
jgi:hypothetical protein